MTEQQRASELYAFVRARLDDDELWATEASRPDGAEEEAAPGGVHWQWQDVHTDAVAVPSPGEQAYVNEGNGAVSLRSREMWPCSTGELPQFALGYVEEVPSAVGGHVIRHAPARVLAEVEAKRELVRVAEGSHDHHVLFMSGVSDALTGVLRRFALAYADHEDYREEWRP